MAQLRPKIVKLAKIIGGVTGITTKIDENAPEYYCMASILTNEEADVAIAAGLRRERTAAYLAKKVGKTVQEVQPLLDNLVYYGIFRRSHNETLGEDTYYMQIFAPGILEMMVNQQDLLETHPEVGRAFEEYTRNLAANMGAMIPDGYGLMRVIPVESALEDIPGVNEFERISHYLDKYDRFSVSPCSCRASRTSSTAHIPCTMTKRVLSIPLKYPTKQYASERTKLSMELARRNSAETSMTAASSMKNEVITPPPKKPMSDIPAPSAAAVSIPSHMARRSALGCRSSAFSAAA